LEDIEKCRSFCLVQFIKQLGVLVIVFLMKDVFPDYPALHEPFVFFQTEEMLNNIL